MMSNTLYGEVQGHITKGGALSMQRELAKASRVLVFLAFFVATMLLAGCSGSIPFQKETGTAAKDSTTVKQETITVYYITREGNYLVPVNTQVPEDEDFCRHVVEKIVAGPQDKELTELLCSPFPQGVLLKYVYVKDGRICVDLGGETIETMDPQVWQRALDSLVFTLTELPDLKIESIEVLVNGLANNGALLERPNQINPIPGEPDDGLSIMVYFSYNDVYLVPVTVKVDPNTTDILKATLEQLVAGPRGIPYLSSVFPEGTRLLGCQQEGDLVHLNFSQEAVLRDTKGNIRKEEQSPTIGALALTLGKFPGIDRFQILIEGKSLPDINYPITVPRSYLDLADSSRAQPEG